jgi:membrane protein DedA with SNARE-associated domain
MGIDLNNFQQAFSWVSSHGYAVIFLAMCIEGPVITAAAGFAAALGFFNPFIILTISILGDLIPDSTYYFLGRKSRFKRIESMMQSIGLTHARLERLENLLKKNYYKTLVAMKLTPVPGPFGYMLIGYLKLSYRGFIFICAAVTIPKSVVFLLIGYYFGQLYNINVYIHNISFFGAIVVISIIALYLAYVTIAKIIAKKFGKL